MSESRQTLIELFNALGKRYLAKNIAISSKLDEDHDIHAFYRLANDPDRVVHLQGYPGLCEEGSIYVSARLRDYNKMMNIQKARTASIGNEHEANIPGAFKELEVCGATLLPTIDALEAALKKACKLLKPERKKKNKN